MAWRYMLGFLLLLGLLPAGTAAAQGAPSACQFVLGFATIQQLIPGQVGTCTDNESHNPANGDALQHTTGGLLVWRKADNWTAFTDGFHTWINGPTGLQERLNSERFSWEAPGPLADCPLAPTSPFGVRALPTICGLSSADSMDALYLAMVIFPARDTPRLYTGPLSGVVTPQLLAKLDYFASLPPHASSTDPMIFLIQNDGTGSTERFSLLSSSADGAVVRVAFPDRAGSWGAFLNVVMHSAGQGWQIADTRCPKAPSLDLLSSSDGLLTLACSRA